LILQVWHDRTRLSTSRHTIPTLTFSFHDTTTTDIYTLSLHDALPISAGVRAQGRGPGDREEGHRRGHHRGHHLGRGDRTRRTAGDRKSTRLNSSHVKISYAVFCLKKKKKKN